MELRPAMFLHSPLQPDRYLQGVKVEVQAADGIKNIRTLEHRGSIFTFANTVSAAGQIKIGYSVLVPQAAKPAADETWRDFTPLEFPRELRPVGQRLIVVDLGSAGIPTPDTPFDVCADAGYIYIFRASLTGSLYVDRFYFDDSALCLVNVPEVRFRRSRNPDVPLDRKDTFGDTDMNRKVFVEPTLDLTFIDKAGPGRFVVAILPTELPNVSRWLILINDETAGTFIGYSIPRTADGLFDLTDAIDPDTGQVTPDRVFKITDEAGAVLTPSAAPALALYNRQEMLLDEYGRPTLQKRALRCLVAVPVAPDGRIAVLDGGVDQDGRLAAVGDTVKLPLAPTPRTGLELAGARETTFELPSFDAATISFEMWFWPSDVRSGVVYLVESASTVGRPFILGLVDGAPVATVGSVTVAADGELPPGNWHHLALVTDGETATLYVNGQPYVDEGDPIPAGPTVEAGYRVGGAQGGDGLVGEIRLWTCERTQAEIVDNMGRTIASGDPAWAKLDGYWPCIEPSDDKRFSVVPNLSRLGAAADGALDGAGWASSNIPIEPSFSPVVWDGLGLTTCTGVLAFAATRARPAIVDGGDSFLHLYYVDGASGQLAAALMSTVTARAEYEALWTAGDPKKPDTFEVGALVFAARNPGSWMNAPAGLKTVEIVAAKKKGYGAIVLTSPAGRTEKWPEVPLDVGSLTAIINGDAAAVGEAEEDELAYDYAKVKVTETGLQVGPAPGPGVGSAIFSILPISDPSNGDIAVVEPTDEGPDSPVRAAYGVDQRWVGYVPLATIRNDQLGSFIKVLDETSARTQPGDLDCRGDVCVEAWVAPIKVSATEPQTVFLFNRTGEGPADTNRYTVRIEPSGQIFAAKDDVVRITKAAMPLDGSWRHLSASYATDYGVQLGGTRYLDAGNDRSLTTVDAVTVEAWVKLDSLGAPQVVASKWARLDGKSWSLSVEADGRLNFRVNQSTATVEVEKTVRSDRVLTQGVWHHVAAIYDIASKPQSAAKFDGLMGYLALPRVDNTPQDAITVMMWIRSEGNFRAGTQMLFQNIDLAEKVRVALYLSAGVLVGKCAIDGQTYTARWPRALRANDWIHVAVTCSAAEGLELIVDGQSSKAVQGEGTPEDDADMVAAVEKLQADRPIAYLVGNDASFDQGFGGTINEISLWNRRLTLDQVRQKIQQPLAASEAGLAGYWPCQDLYGESVMDLVGSASGTLHYAGFVRMPKGAFAQKILIDGQLEVFDRVTDPLVASDTVMLLGAGDGDGFLQGALDDVRLWNQGRMNWQIEYFRAERLEDNAQGLVSEWSFSTGKGRVAFDSKSQNNASISDKTVQLSDEAVDAMWIKTSFKAGWTIMLNGDVLPVEALALDPTIYGSSQATIGATRWFDDGASSFVNQFTGRLNEVRLWSTQRTPLQVRQALNVAVTGRDAGLAAYWPVSDGSGRRVGDFTGRAHNGRWVGGHDVAPWILSAAPIGVEAPGIRMANGGVEPKNPILSDSAAQAAAYGSTQTDAYGNLIATYRRAYAILPKGKGLDLTVGLLIGELDIQFVGQVQLNPSLIGYIEGSPPVPSENLKVYPGSPGTYNGASSIVVDETASVSYAYTASRDTGFDMSVNSSLGFRWEEEIDAGGLVVSTFLFGFISNIGVSASFSNSLGWISDATLTEDRVVNSRRQLELRGGWAANNYAIDGGVGQIFAPSNTGYALVRSGTADMFALRLRGSGALVTYSLRPNPDIPEDVNIILFKIDPRYVKNGTLDGWIGYQPDKTYSYLTPGERGSYFKPLEAYALKQLIDREHAQSGREFSAFDAGSIGRRTNTLNFQPGDLGDGRNSVANILMGVADRDTISTEEWLRRRGRRNMVNTYVWTAGGGLYAEEQQFTISRQMVSGGSYSFQGMAGPSVGLVFRKGGYFELDAMFGGHIVTQATKSVTDTAGFSLNVSVTGESYVGTIEGEDDDLQYTDVPSPGKVTQYRFMSFYLAPSKRNFADFKSIVDRDWLNRTGHYAGTSDPDATALRQALFRPNEVWRVLHRVTYVARVPMTQQTAQSVPKDARRPDTESVVSNVLLIDELVPDSRTNPMPSIGVKADALLVELSKNPVWGAQVAATRDVLKQDIMTYLRGFYEVASP